MKTINRFIFTIVMLIFISCNLQSSITSSNLIEQPYYVVNFKATACSFEIRVNDYPIVNMETSRRLSVAFPINHAILESGIQSISATILPNAGEAQLDPVSELRFNIQLFDVTDGFELIDEFGDYQSEPVEERELSTIEYTGSFQADVPYKLDVWQKGIDLSELDDCREKLEQAYNNIIELFKAGEFEKFKQMISKREHNTATVMYLSEEESEKRINGLFDPNFKIQPIPKDVVMVLYANNKIAALKKTNGEHVITLVNSENGEEITLDILFYIPEGKDEFEII